MAYCKEGQISPNQRVLLDGGFTCVKAGPTTILFDEDGLFFKCRAGHHYIDGQLNDDDEYIGISSL